MNVINLETRRQDKVDVLDGRVYTLFVRSKGVKLVELELEVTGEGDTTTYYLKPGENPDELFGSIPRAIEQRIRELLK